MWTAACMPSAAECTLIVLRHAKAQSDGRDRDAERELTPRGRRDAAAAGAALPVRPEVVVCSPARRAVQTWEAVRAAAGLDLDASYEPSIYEAGVEDLLDVVAALPEDRAVALLVGHNPGCEDLVAAVTGSPVRLATCAYAVLRWPGRWTDARGPAVELVAHETPRG